MPRRFWTDDAIVLAIRMRDEDRATEEIAQALGRTVDAVELKFKWIRKPKGERHPRFWSAQEDATLRRLKAENADWERIAVAVGRNKHKCQSRWRYLTRNPEEHRAQLDRLAQRYRRLKGRNVCADVPLYLKPAMQVRLAEAASRRHRDFTAEFFGDPPIGYSALDKRTGAAP